MDAEKSRVSKILHLTRAKLWTARSRSRKKGKSWYSWSGARQLNGVRFHVTKESVHMRVCFMVRSRSNITSKPWDHMGLSSKFCRAEALYPYFTRNKCLKTYMVCTLKWGALMNSMPTTMMDDRKNIMRFLQQPRWEEKHHCWQKEFLEGQYNWLSAKGMTVMELITLETLPYVNYLQHSSNKATFSVACGVN